MTPDRSHSDTVGRVAYKVRVKGGFAPFNPYFYLPKQDSFEFFSLLLDYGHPVGTQSRELSIRNGEPSNRMEQRPLHHEYIKVVFRSSDSYFTNIYARTTEKKVR